MTLKTRLIISLGLLTAIIIGLIVAGYVTLNIMSGTTRMLVDEHIGPIRNLKTVADAYAVAIVDNVHKTRAGTVSWPDAMAEMKGAEAVIAASWSEELERPKPEEDVAPTAKVADTMAAATNQMAELTQILEQRDQAALVEFAENRLYPAIDPISAAISDYIVLLEQGAIDDLEGEALFQQAVMASMVAAGLIAVIAIGYGGYVIVRSVADRLRQLQRALSGVAGGDLGLAIPFVGRRDEIGLMAQAAEVFRQNGVQLREMTAKEAAERTERDAARKEMMTELKSAFGTVVNAAGSGDLAPRVSTDFADAELNSLAGDVNRLLDAVEQGITATGDVLAALASADLSRRVHGNFQGAFGRLKDDTNAVAQKMAEIIGDLRNTSASLRTATGEILAGANDLAERTTRQAATIEETSAAMEQLAATVASNADRAGLASRQAETAAATAGDSGLAMQDATTAMTRIAESSNRIANIIGMIDDIAFQTNLLALNASVEAARAGDAGRGFAVVAQEVRRLAQSAAASSSEVKSLIAQSEHEVQNGGQLVTSAAATLETVLATIRQNATTMQSIAAASRDQAGAIGEVTAAVRQLDEMTQHNAALVEQTNAAIEQTEAQAVALDGLISVFKVEAGRAEPISKGVVARRSSLAIISRDNLAHEWTQF